ncbi:tRNA pseudouridine synthase [Cerioporus squamosus]|nr:tRNA pseudouridine synthase [Cerioporus squamosus]
MPGGFSYRLLRPYARFTRMEPYKNWSREELIARLQHLDPHHDRPRPPTQAQGKPFDFNAYPKRKIALKFTYNGIHYGGMEYQRDPALPTVEGVLFDALVHTRLVDRAGGLEGCGWQRCGRTDKGVSASGQVVSLWVRSTLGSKPRQRMKQRPPSSEVEFPYVFGLNHILPPTIRVLAWSPVSDEFSARFSCRWRHYKYFFSPRGLDLAAMSDAAARLVGERDFRNLCKVDASKQITAFTRRILSATIDRADAHGDLYVFNLRGNAFLYNMVRHIMGILFLVGSGSRSRRRRPAPVVTGKPDYLIADPLPLMLWDCGYDDGVLDWRTDRASPKTGESTKSPLPGMICDLERATITAALDEHFLKAAEAHHKPPKQYFPLGAPGVEPLHPGAMMSVPLGGGIVKRLGTYVPLLQRKRMPTPDEVNERYRLGRGAKKLGRKAAPAVVDEGDE